MILCIIEFVNAVRQFDLVYQPNCLYNSMLLSSESEPILTLHIIADRKNEDYEESNGIEVEQEVEDEGEGEGEEEEGDGDEGEEEEDEEEEDDEEGEEEGDEDEER